MQIFALVYAPLFLLMAFRRPVWALIAIFALAPLQIGLGIAGTGVEFSLAEVNLLLTFIVWILKLRRTRYGLSLGPLAQPILGYLLVSLSSSLISWRGSDAVTSLLQTVLYTVITVLIFSTFAPVNELPRVLYSLLPVATIWSFVGVGSGFHFMLLGKNAFGGIFSLAFLVALDLLLAKGHVKRPWQRDWGRYAIFGAMLILAGGLILSLSRGAWMGAFGGVFVIMMLRRASMRMAKMAIMFFPLLLILWSTLPEKQQKYAFGFEKERYNIRARYRSLAIAEKAFASSPVLGTGTGLRKQYDATNIIWSTLAETGVLGMASLLWIFIVLYRLSWRSRYILPSSDPRFSLLTLGCALMTCKILHGMVDNYWGRGSITIAWGALGMMLAYCRIPLEERTRQIVESRRRRLSALPQFAPSPASVPSPQAMATSPFSADGAHL